MAVQAWKIKLFDMCQMRNLVVAVESEIKLDKGEILEEDLAINEINDFTSCGAFAFFDGSERDILVLRFFTIALQVVKFYKKETKSESKTSELSHVLWRWNARAWQFLLVIIL